MSTPGTRMKTYRHGRYHVDVAPDGAIKVQPGDCLSKYSAAIHNDFWHVYEYGRKKRQGVMERIRNVNVIYTGETLYHLPTYEETIKAASVRSPIAPVGSPKPTPPPLVSDAEKKRITLEMLEKDYNLRGEHLHVLEEAYEIIHTADTVGTLAEIAHLIAEEGAMAAASTVLEILSTVLLPVMAFIEIWNASETGQRMYGMRAVAYTTTAWAFDDPIPTRSPIIQNDARDFYGPDSSEVKFREKAWKEASDATLGNLKKTWVQKKVSERSLQVLLRALGDDERTRLCLLILQGFEEELPSYPGVVREIWRSNYSVKYPN